jgi:hypothetical protein
MTLGKTPWRELNLEDIALWDAAPRRFVLGLLASLVLFCVTLYWLMPQYEVLQQRRQLNHQLQTQFAQQVNPWALAQKSQGASGQGVQALSKDALAIWLATIASDAQTLGLTGVKVAPQMMDASQGAGSAAPADSLAAISGRVLLQADGGYAALARWWAALSASEHVLSMSQIEMNGVGDKRVHGQVLVRFALEVRP